MVVSSKQENADLVSVEINVALEGKNPQDAHGWTTWEHERIAQRLVSLMVIRHNFLQDHDGTNRLLEVLKETLSHYPTGREEMSSVARWSASLRDEYRSTASFVEFLEGLHATPTGIKQHGVDLASCGVRYTHMFAEEVEVRSLNNLTTQWYHQDAEHRSQSVKYLLDMVSYADVRDAFKAADPDTLVVESSSIYTLHTDESSVMLSDGLNEYVLYAVRQDDGSITGRHLPSQWADLPSPSWDDANMPEGSLGIQLMVRKNMVERVYSEILTRAGIEPIQYNLDTAGRVTRQLRWWRKVSSETNRRLMNTDIVIKTEDAVRHLLDADVYGRVAGRYGKVTWARYNREIGGGFIMKSLGGITLVYRHAGVVAAFVPQSNPVSGFDLHWNTPDGSSHTESVGRISAGIALIRECESQ